MTLDPQLNNADPFADRRRELSACRFQGQISGHYESYFLRANHPDRPLAFWIRYTIFAPRNEPQRNQGELWVMVFDGDRNQITAAKMEYPLRDCRFDTRGLDVSIGGATLQTGFAQGEASQGDHHIQWDLHYSPGVEPVLLLPDNLYDTALPKAKALVTDPLAVFRGELRVDGTVIPVENWTGSMNHNWGSKHTDQYAWAQVAGFDNAPDAFLECGTARLKLGPVWTPWLTTLVLRLDGRLIKLNGLLKAIRAKAHYGYFHWHFDTADQQVRIVGDIQAPRTHFVGLNYYNPPGGSHTCLNCKIANARLLVQENGRPDRVLQTVSRAAFEILTDDTSHGISVVA
ncbi:MAG TPA: hypothetical protein VM553_11875 [Dongiaceae bacterium]|nr:hypothetical protein [Dongiaceae bacterium]